MDPTTLVTFLFRAPADTRTVELLGSWDQFSQPYRMHNDRRRGIWSGIFKFENISFDGDDLRWTKPRSGGKLGLHIHVLTCLNKRAGLRQGATYWYYYRLNSYDDAFDERQPCTLACPLMLGQKVNIIDVPIELRDLPARCCSSSNIEGNLSDWHQLQTMDPATKFDILDPPPVSKIHARALSDGTLQGRLENPPLSIVEETVSRPSTPYLECPDATSPDRIDSSNGISHGSSLHSRDTLCSATTDSLVDLTQSQLGRSFQGNPRSSTRHPAALPASGESPVGCAPAKTAATDPRPEDVQSASLEFKKRNHMRKMSSLSIGPISVQNVQFYNESRPGTRLNEDPEQYRPRVYSLPNSELRSSEDGKSQVSPMSTAAPDPVPSRHQDEIPTPDSDVADFDLGSPTFSAATATSDGEESPPHLSPQNSVKRNTRLDGGGTLTGLANRLRSIRARQRFLTPRREADQHNPRLSPTSFVNCALPAHAESTHSLAKTRSIPSNHGRSSHSDQPEPVVLGDDEHPLPSRFPEEVESSLVDDIFSELGYLGASIG